MHHKDLSWGRTYIAKKKVNRNLKESTMILVKIFSRELDEMKSEEFKIEQRIIICPFPFLWMKENVFLFFLFGFWFHFFVPFFVISPSRRPPL